MRRSFGIAALAAGILSVSACGPAGGGPEAPALQEESRETEGTQETKVIQETEEIQKTEGVTVLMNSHNLELSLEFSDRIIGLKDGSVAFDGKPEQLDETMIHCIYEKDA